MNLFSVTGINNTDICHRGVKGQKWYLRRYQNLDGTLTDLGRKRYTKQAISEINKFYKKNKKARNIVDKNAKKVQSTLKKAKNSKKVEAIINKNKDKMLILNNESKIRLANAKYLIDKLYTDEYIYLN